MITYESKVSCISVYLLGSTIYFTIVYTLSMYHAHLENIHCTGLFIIT